MSCTAVQTYYAGDGVQTLFTFPFEYLNESDVKVGIYDDTTELYVDKAQDDATYGWSFSNSTTIEFVTAPIADPDAPDGNNIRIYRNTDVDSLEATFYPGSSIRAQDLNDNFDQLRMALEEGQCYFSDEQQTELDDRYWAKINSYTSVDQLAQNPVSDDTIITSQAAADRHDTILSDNTSTPVQPGKLWANTRNNTFQWWDGPNSTWVNSGQAGPKGDKGDKGDKGEPGSGGAVYKGQTDFTAVEPSNPANGDFWINTVDGNGNWTGFTNVPVSINDRAIYNSTTSQWDLIPASDEDSSWTVINNVTQPSNVNVDTVREENFSVGTASLSSTINANGVTVNRAVSLPDKNGTIALTSDLPTAPSDAKITLTAGTNLTGGGDFTLNQATDKEITFNATVPAQETYDLNAAANGSDVDMKLTSGSGTDDSSVKITAGDNIKLESISSTEIKVSSTASSGDSNTEPGGTGDGSGGIGTYFGGESAHRLFNVHPNKITFNRNGTEYKCEEWLTHGRGNGSTSLNMCFSSPHGGGYIEHSGHPIMWGMHTNSGTAPEIMTYFKFGAGGPYTWDSGYRFTAVFRDGGYTRFAMNGDPDYAKFSTDLEGNPLNLPAGEYFAGLESVGMSDTQGVWLTRNGLIFHTGYNGYGQSGRGVTTQYHFPTLIPLYDVDGATKLENKDRPKIRQISNSSCTMYYQSTVNHTLAVDFDGNVYAWGYNGYGQLGDGTATTSYKAKKIDPVWFDNKKVMWIQAYYNQSLAITEDGYIYAWGINNYNAINTNLVTNVTYPRCLNSTGFFEVKSFAPASDPAWTVNKTSVQPDSTDSAEGAGIRFTLNFVSGAPTVITIVDMGNGKYKDGDTVTFNASTIGAGATDLVITLEDVNEMREKVIVHAYWLGYTTQSLMMLDSEGTIWVSGYSPSHGSYTGVYSPTAIQNLKYPHKVDDQSTTTLSDGKKTVAMFCGYDIGAYCMFAITDGGTNNQPKLYGWGYNATGQTGRGFGKRTNTASPTVGSSWGLEEVQFDFPTTGENNTYVEVGENGQFSGYQYDTEVQNKLKPGKFVFVEGASGLTCFLDDKGNTFFAGSGGDYSIMSGTDGIDYYRSMPLVTAPYVANSFDFLTPPPNQPEAMSTVGFPTIHITFTLGTGKSGSLYGTQPYVYNGGQSVHGPANSYRESASTNLDIFNGWRRLSLGL